MKLFRHIFGMEGPVRPKSKTQQEQVSSTHENLETHTHSAEEAILKEREVHTRFPLNGGANKTEFL